MLTERKRWRRNGRPRTRISIFWHCTIINTIIYSVGFLLAAALLLVFVGVSVWQDCERTIKDVQGRLEQELKHSQHYDTLWITLAYLELPANAAYRVLDDGGMLLVETMAYLPFPDHAQANGEIYLNQRTAEEGLLYTTLETARWISTVDDRVLLQVSYDITWFMQVSDTILYWILFLFPFILLISLLVSYITTKLSFAPVRELSRRIQDITPASLGQAVQMDVNNSEWEELLENYNAMSHRLQQSFENQRLFVSNASHELRSPIVTIKGYSSMLLRWGKENNEILNESLAIIDTEAQHMADIVQTLLSIARYESEKEQMPLSFSWVDLKMLVGTVAEEMERKALERGLSVKIESEIRANLIWGDAKSIAQALRIVLENAVQYGEEKPIVIRVYDRKDKSVIEVQDQGIGMSDEEREKIGQHFYRSEKAREVYTDGLGLGLSMLMKILQAHSGTLEIESQKNVGTSMRMVWPRENQNEDMATRL